LTSIALSPNNQGEECNKTPLKIEGLKKNDPYDDKSSCSSPRHWCYSSSNMAMGKQPHPYYTLPLQEEIRHSMNLK